MVRTETRTDEHSFIIPMSAAAGSRKFATDVEKQRDGAKGVKGEKKE